MHKTSKIFLIGFMGSGKSTAGRKLASQLNWKFIDLDEKIEEIEGIKIQDIFSLKGQPYFRKLETKVLKELRSETDTVISTGGGTPCFGDNMEIMLNSGLTVYLKMTPASLKKRLAKLSEGRPLLKDIDRKDLKGFITMKLAEREKWYSMAEIVIDDFNDDLSDLLSLIKKQIAT
jgi:shikimate kinase